MSRRKLYHPLWTHIPAVAMIGYIIARFVAAMPLPNRVPVHFDLAGQPNRWGSPWELFAVTVGLSALYLGISILGDELWARQENRKAFNWLALIDDLIIGMMAGVFAHYGDFKNVQAMAPTISIAIWPTAAVLVAAVLEYLRPHVPFENHYQPEDTSRLEMEIGSFVEEGKPWVYWESQNPAWVNWILAAAMASTLLGAWNAYRELPTAAIPLALISLLFVFLYGGLRVMVTPIRIQVKLGLFGIPLLKLQLTELTEVKTHHFSPLRDFGGYGIRVNKAMKAYYWRGNEGVLVTTTRGKKYLIGSDHPERLAAVTEIARRMAGG